MLKIVDAETEEDFDAVRRLCWAYRDVLLALGPPDSDAVLHYYPEAAYRALMDDLPRIHARPAGTIKLAWLDGLPVGCGMSHTLSPGVAEIKRVYIAPEARGRGAGRAMMEALIGQLREDGFDRIVMDTARKLTTAVRLYDRLGFRRRGPYRETPAALLPQMVFFEMDL